MNKFQKAIKILRQQAGIANPEIALELNSAINFLENGGKTLTTKNLNFLKFVTTITSKKNIRFNTKSFFSELNGILLSEEFKLRILPLVSKVTIPTAYTINNYKIIKRDMYDSEIIAELGDPPMFTLDECLNYLKDSILSYSKNIHVALSANRLNVLYVILGNKNLVITALKKDKWELDCYDLTTGGDGEIGWSIGTIVHSL